MLYYKLIIELNHKVKTNLFSNKKTPAITITAGVPSFIIVNYVAILQSLIAEFEIHFHQYSEPYNNRQAAIQYLIR